MLESAESTMRISTGFLRATVERDIILPSVVLKLLSICLQLVVLTVLQKDHDSESHVSP